MFDEDDILDDFVPDAPAATKMTGEPQWIQSLNPKQKQAVLTTQGAMLILAGAGTGKTKVLTSRMANILFQDSATPYNILCVTFTNKAAAEMQKRVESITGQLGSGLWLGTFHSICLRILRRHAEMLNMTSDFVILDDDDQIRVIKQLLPVLGIDDKRWPAKQLLTHIQRWKDSALLPNAVPMAEASRIANGKMIDLYQSYQNRLRSLNALDFGDLILYCVDLFRKHKDILNEYGDRFQYILVDEYQDTNVAQYEWLKLLASVHQNPNICCVGDDDQSIYGWRGADVGNILRFEQDFPESSVIRLEQNYRSTGHILECANKVIANNTERLGKELYTQLGDGEKVHVENVWDGDIEARSISDVISTAYGKGENLSEMAILVRAGFMTRLFEEQMMRLEIPYRVVGGARFYEREEIRDAVAYLRILHQPNDDLAFERIINKPARGIGKATIQILQKLSRLNGKSMYVSALQILETEELPARAKNKLDIALKLFEKWRTMLDVENNTTILETVLDQSGYLQYWKTSKDVKAPTKLENLKELSTAVQSFDNIRGFLEHIALVMELADTKDSEQVSIMTLHAAKGLEFDTVFLPGWEDGLFPSERSLEEKGLVGLEEERRLAYVGITRAKKNCYIYCANNRVIHGKYKRSIPSQFLEELPLENIQTPMTMDRQPTTNTTGWDSISGDVEMMIPADSAGWNTGQRCFHQKFGMGTVTTVDGDYLSIAFDKSGLKKVVASFVEEV